jgi:hypothetical protein
MNTSAWWTGCSGAFGWIILLLALLCVAGMAGMAGMMFWRRRWSGMCHGMGIDSSPDRSRETPRQILDRRFASGELTRASSAADPAAKLRRSSSTRPA